MPGLQDIPLRAPDRWDAAWFERFVRETLSRADIRNANEGTGISISGTSDEVATVSASEDVEALTEATLLTLTASDLTNGFEVVPTDGITLQSIGGNQAQLGLANNGIPSAKLQAIPADRLEPITQLSVIGSPTEGASDGTGQSSVTAVDVIESSANDTILRRVEDTGVDVLDFGKLTLAMAPDSLWTNAKLADMAEATIKGRQASSGTGVPEDLSASEVKTILDYQFSDIGGSIGDAQVPESAVTQHEAALAIGFDQLTGNPEIPGGLDEYADDAAAEVGGIAVDGLYRTGSVVKIRVS